MADNTFDQMKAHLIARLGNENIFIGKEFSYFKIFQHGIIYDFNGNSNKLLRTYFLLPSFLQKMIWIKNSMKKKSKSFSLKENVWLEPGRVYETSEGELISMYGTKLMHEIGHACSSINLSPEKGVKSDFTIHDVYVASSGFDSIENDVLEDIIRISRRLHKSDYYTSKEKHYIDSALHVFYSSFRMYYNMLKGRNIKKLFFTGHYHNEGVIAACKKLNIECIELQHGLINKKDLYYAYDKAFKKSLENGMMPDKILLYGPYWKGVLDAGCEWSENGKVVVGNYLAHNYVKPDASKKENIILVATQKGMDDKYIPYIEKLKQFLVAYPDWKLLVKLHPLEKRADRYSFLKSAQCEIAPLQSNIFHFLEKCKIQISIYSTTFFDAAGFDVINFSWVTHGVGSDYAQSLADDGVVIPVTPDDDILGIYYNKSLVSSELLHIDNIYPAMKEGVFNEMINESQLVF
jgi:hypothetical protein